VKFQKWVSRKGILLSEPEGEKDDWGLTKKDGVGGPEIELGGKRKRHKCFYDGESGAALKEGD